MALACPVVRGCYSELKPAEGTDDDEDSSKLMYHRHLVKPGKHHSSCTCKR